MNHPVKLPDQLTAHLRSLRKARGLTQAQLGERLGVKQVRIAEIEKDPGSISVDQLMRLLAALGSSLVLSDRSAAPVEPSAHVTAKTLLATRGASPRRTGTPPPGKPLLKGQW